jgi:hypothetical protein
MDRKVKIWLHAFLASALNTSRCEWLLACHGHSNRTLWKAGTVNHRIRGCVTPEPVQSLSCILSIYAVILPGDFSYSKGIALMIIPTDTGSIAKDFHCYLLGDRSSNYSTAWIIYLRQDPPIVSLGQ